MSRYRLTDSSGKSGFGMCCYGSGNTTTAHDMGRTVGEDVARRTHNGGCTISVSSQFLFPGPHHDQAIPFCCIIK